jgi:hypothetical protein
MLKELILAGRFIKADGSNASWEEIEKVVQVHHLKKLCETFREDARSKIDQEFWNALDIEYVENLLLEFDAVDKRSVAFRYEDQAGHIADFKRLHENLDHVNDVLNKLNAYLTNKYLKNDDMAWPIALSWLEMPDF